MSRTNEQRYRRNRIGPGTMCARFGSGRLHDVNTVAAMTRKQLKEIVRYNPRTGAFRLIASGKPIGGKSSHGTYKYIRIRINAHSYYAHRLAWLYVHGVWPKLIDHINGNGLDNRLNNLRVATHTQNHINSKRYANNKVGLKGVSIGNAGRFRATTKHRGKQILIGHFDNPQDAHAAYINKVRQLHGKYANEG